MTIGDLYLVSNSNTYFRIYDGVTGNLLNESDREDLSGNTNFDAEVHGLWVDDENYLCIQITIPE